MHYLVALILSIAGIFGLSQPSIADVSASSVEASTTIEASKDASLPTYLSEVTTSPKAEASQVVVPTIPAPEVGVPTQPVEPATVEPVQCEEDMPCWDGSANDNRAHPVQPVQCEEDMPCWDCETMGNLQCGPSASNEADAFASFDSQTGLPAITEEMKLSYVATVPVEPTTLEVGEFAIPDSNQFDTWHIMRWDVLTTA